LLALVAAHVDLDTPEAHEAIVALSSRLPTRSRDTGRDSST
jgi:hypothetical protein